MCAVEAGGGAGCLISSGQLIPGGPWALSLSALLPIIVLGPSLQMAHPNLQITCRLHLLGGCMASGHILGLVGRSQEYEEACGHTELMECECPVLRGSVPRD